MNPESLVGKRFTTDAIAPLLAKPDEEPQLDDFAEMKMREYRRNGLDVYIDSDGRLAALFFYGTNTDGHDRYSGPLPHSLSFDKGLPEVAQQLGDPTRTGSSKSGGRWVRYDYPKHATHLEFIKDESRITKITLMSPSMAAGDV
jgi:hypothetical protein